MRAKAKELGLGPAARMDEWLGRQIGMTPQAIRNYVTAQREPRNAAVVEAIEDALDLPRHRLGTFLGYGPPPFSMSPELLDQLGSIEQMAREHPGAGGFSVTGWLGQARRQIAQLEARVAAVEAALVNQQFALAAEKGELDTTQTGTVQKPPATGGYDPDEE
jgi:hypothetical protein